MKTALILAAVVLTAATPAFAVKKSTFSELSGPQTGTGPGTAPNNNSFWNNIGNASGAQIPQNVTPAPEPGEWAMMIAGLAVVGFAARRRQA